jgi:hypothetical protein
MQMSVTSLIRNFSNFLNLSWTLVQDTFEGEDEQDVKDDWFQVNWELLVERDLGVQVFLEVYGNGADCYGASSRVTFNEELPTHSIICKSNSDRPLKDLLGRKKLLNDSSDLVFDRLVTMTGDGWYAETLPFDKVLCLLENDEVILNLDELEFSLLENEKSA